MLSLPSLPIAPLCTPTTHLFYLLLVEHLKDSGPFTKLEISCFAAREGDGEEEGGVGVWVVGFGFRIDSRGGFGAMVIGPAAVRPKLSSHVVRYIAEESQVFSSSIWKIKVFGEKDTEFR